MFYFLHAGNAFTVLYGGDAEEVNSNLNWRNKELLEYAATTGQSVRVEVVKSSQTILTQHHVAVQLDCADLLRDGNSSVSWSKVNLDQEGISGKI